MRLHSSLYCEVTATSVRSWRGDGMRAYCGGQEARSSQAPGGAFSTSTIQRSGSKAISRLSRSSASLGSDAVPAVRPSENPLDARTKLGGDGLRRRPVEGRASVQVIDLDENGASLRGAAAAQRRACPLHSASTQISGDPDVGPQAQPAQRPPARAAAVSCLRSRGVISVEGGKPWARSKSRTACWVAAPSFPSGFTG